MVLTISAGVVKKNKNTKIVRFTQAHCTYQPAVLSDKFSQKMSDGFGANVMTHWRYVPGLKCFNMS